MDYKMKVSTIEKFHREDGTERKIYYQDRRDVAAKKFPFTVITEGSYPENDFACRWCWQQFGPMDVEKCGDHESEYPACPLVLATKPYVEKHSYTDKDGKLHEYDFHTRDPGEHSHEGTWTVVWLGKTGYDYGFSEHYFKNEADRDKFIEAVPSFNLGENYAEE